MGVGRDAGLSSNQALKESRCTVIARTVPRFSEWGHQCSEVFLVAGSGSFLAVGYWRILSLYRRNG